jgi:hypothetical protein
MMARKILPTSNSSILLNRIETGAKVLENQDQEGGVKNLDIVRSRLGERPKEISNHLL